MEPCRDSLGGCRERDGEAPWVCPASARAIATRSCSPPLSASANRPALILADEATAALDRARGRAVMELFRRVAQEQGAAVLVVTHDHRTRDDSRRWSRRAGDRFGKLSSDSSARSEGMS